MVRDYEVERSGEDRRQNFCSAHIKREDDIGYIKEIVSSHRGQWKVLLWGGAVFASMLLSMVYMQKASMDKTTEVVVGMDKTFTAYMTMHMAESVEGLKRISTLEEKQESTHDSIIKLDSRVRVLESK